MPNSSAQVKSTDALMDFRACLIKQCEEYSFAIQSGKSDVRKMQQWLKNEQAPYLKKLSEKCQETLSRRKIELLRKKNIVTTKSNSCIDEKRALEKAKRHYEEVQTKIKNLKKWTIQLDKDTLDFNGQLQELTTLIDTKLPKAQNSLEQMVISIERYRQVVTPHSEIDTVNKSMQMALPDQSIDITVALAKSLRSKTPNAKQRHDSIENNTLSFRDSIISGIDFKTIEIEYHQQTYMPSNKITIDTNASFVSPIYLERVATTSQANDSVWYIGNVSDKMEPLLASTSIGDIQYDCQGIEKIFLMPAGTLILLSRQGIEIFLDLNDNVLINNGQNQ